MKKYRGASPFRVNDDNPFWLSISDLMAVLMLIFVFVTAVALVFIGENEVKIRIFSLLKQELEEAQIKVELNEEHGTVSIADRILFNSNASVLKPEGQAFLEKFVPILERVLFADEKILDEIVSVDIEGYSSQNYMSRDFREKMMLLSLKRSESVWSYINGIRTLQHETDFLKKIKVCGWGNMKALSDEDLPDDRRVTFQLQFKGQLEKLKALFTKISN